MTDPDELEDEPPPDAFSAAALRDAADRDRDETLDEGEGRDRHQ